MNFSHVLRLPRQVHFINVQWRLRNAGHSACSHDAFNQSINQS